MSRLRQFVTTDRLLLALIVVYGAVLRSKGFTRRDLWFDDAWVMAPARIPFGRAIHLVNTTPGFSVFMWAWNHLYPQHTWFLQLPIFVTSVAAIVVLYWALRQFDLWRPLPLVGALLLAVAPILTMYATHLKQYNDDTIVACVALVLAERWRRQPSRRLAIQIALLSVTALFFSASTYLAIVPLVAIAAHTAFTQRAHLRAVLLFGGAAVASLAVVWVVWLRHLSNGMIVGWTTRGYLMDYSTWHSRAFSIQTMGTQFLHYLVSMPVGHKPDPVHRVTNLGLTLGCLFFLALGALLLRWLGPLIRHPRRALGVGATASATIALSVLMAFARHDPFGGGRTDEVLYPAFLLVVSLLVTALVRRLPGARARRVAALVVAVVVVSLPWMGWDHRVDYPGNSLRSLVTRMEQLRHPTDAVVVDPWMSFTWMADGLPNAAISQDPSQFPWSQGFHVVGTGGNLLFNENYFMPSYYFQFIKKYTHRVWYVTERSGGRWPNADDGDPLVNSKSYQWFIQNGWSLSPTVLFGPHTAIVLLNYTGAKG